MNKFYDTSSLLVKQIIDEPIIISSITLQELEYIKSSAHKDASTKAAARKLLHSMANNQSFIEVVQYRPEYDEPILDCGYEINNDSKILACALYYQELYGDIEFYTNDFALYMFANLFFIEGRVKQFYPSVDTYTGFKNIILSENQLEDLYSNNFVPPCDILINEYLIIRNQQNEIVDKMYWDGKKMRHVTFSTFDSKTLGQVKPYQGDIYQTFAADSLARNKITLLKGPAGVGKSYFALGYLFSLLDKHKIDKIIIFCNTIATKGSAKLGYYPGDKNEKLLDSQIGNFLSSKLGDKMAVERLITDGKLILLPMSDIRGYDTTGMNAGIYITEAQNLDINLMKLALQRIGEDSVCIIDGDPKTQVDDDMFAEENNGMRRVSEVFRGQPYYGEIELQNIYRSQIAQRAEYM